MPLIDTSSRHRDTMTQSIASLRSALTARCLITNPSRGIWGAPTVTKRRSGCRSLNDCYGTNRSGIQGFRLSQEVASANGNLDFQPLIKTLIRRGLGRILPTSLDEVQSVNPISIVSNPLYFVHIVHTPNSPCASPPFSPYRRK